MSELKGMDELREFLAAQGFRCAENGLGSRDNLANWYAYRASDIPARECECNDGKRAQIVVTPSHYVFPNGFVSRKCEVAVTGECAGVWFKLSAYSLTPQECMDRIGEVEKSLIAAWNALK